MVRDHLKLILSMCEGGARKTHVMYRCNLNSKQISEYSDFLVDAVCSKEYKKGLNSKRYIFRTSELGNKFVGRYKQMAESIQQPPPPSIMNE